MLMKIWTGSLLFLAWLSFCAWLVLVCREKNVHPLRDFAMFFKKQTTIGRVLFGTFFLIMWVYASVKPGDGGGNGGGDGGGNGGTNNVPQMVCPPGGSSQMSLPGGALQQQAGLIGQHAGLQPVQPLNGGATLNLSGLNPITSTNTLRTITAEDFGRGFVQTRVGTDEQFDFSPITNATIVSDWRAFGAATDWIYVALTNWAFQVATNDVERLRVYAFGKIEPLIREADNSIATNYWFAPFMASLGVVPQANWDWLSESARPSQVWYAITPENSLVITWQNALLDRDTANPLSFQVEFKTNGQFTYRYDLSRLNADTVTNILSGASFGGNGWTTNAIPTNVTSIVFYPLTEDDAYNQDPDNDGLLTIDELFFYDTDPHNPDTDYDGLTDYEELFIYNTNPLNPHSVSDTYCDGIAVKIGDADPFSYPEGSTNTVLEHVFYSGTTNGVFAYPTSTVETAVLKIMVSGTGTGRLVVGDAVVPLIARPPLRSGAQTNVLFQTVERGVIKTFWWDKPDGLDVAVEADEFLIGELPSLWRLRGWIAFPHTDATVPCIHDFYAKGRMVTLVHGVEFPGLTAEWTSEESGVAITNVPPVSAAIYGSFPKSATRTISYTLNHPNQLNSTAATFTQTLRFCPQLEDEDEPTGGSGGGGDEEPEYWSCGCGWNGTCSCCAGEWCHCSSWDCPCNNNQSPTLDDNDDEEEEAYTNIVNGVLSPLSDVLYLYRSNSRTENLPVPGGPPKKCCPCPEHWASNYVAKVSYSSRVAVKDAAGNDFNIAYEPCAVTVSGVSPSREFRDSTINFVTNGASYKRTDYTVLGLKIDLPSGETPIAKYNQLSQSFGFPVEVCTNLDNASSLVLRTDVLLDSGYVRLALEDVSGEFEIWLPGWWDNHDAWHEPEMLLDGTTKPERYLSMRKWRSIMWRHHETRELEVKVLSSSEGSCRLKVEYATATGSFYVHDFAEQRISSVDPVLLVDYDRDGTVGVSDMARHMDGRYAFFWQNDDKWKDDNAFAFHLINSVNSSDNVVNGRNDLINFLPIAVDIAPFASHWSSSAVYYRLEAHSSALRDAKLAFASIAHTQIGDAPLGNDNDIYGTNLREAPVFELGTGTNLPPAFVTLTHSGRSTLFMEFPEVARHNSLYLNVYSESDNALLFSASIKLHIGEVSKMIGWENLRSVAGGSGGLPTRLATDDWPASEHEPGNLVFVHGYNMAEGEETQLWAQNVFKKLWWAGLDRGFVAVQWRGNEGQVAGTLTPNYYGNVQNAFQTAPALSNAMAIVQGPKWFVAHSLGNMLVSAAIQDYGMQYEKYFMLNAAVALEAFDSIGGITPESHDNMTPRSWTNYVDKVRATHWFERFPEGDGRRLLTWKGRFSGVTKIVNFYSTEEEVVNNGDGGWHTILDRDYVWYNQETRKGLWPMMIHEYEGGWEFNPFYDTVTGSWLGDEYVEQRHHMNPTNAAALTDPQLRQKPFFLDFANPEMYSSSNGVVVASNYLYRAEMLAYAIPSESFAVGANPLPQLVASDLNFNMASVFAYGREDLPENGESTTEMHRNWQHSTFVQRSYKRTHQLFQTIVGFINGGEE